jgi:NAD(P)-dependent dehydrogenase (short-subunit alcohol dehydrogenase family)
MAGRLEGKVAVVTGGNSGIGEAIVHRLASEGARVGFCARRKEQGEAVEAAARSAGATVRFDVCDVTDSSQVDDWIARVTSEYGAIDVVVNNAGTASAGQWPDESNEDWDAILRLNVTSAFYVTRAAWPQLIASGEGSVINIGSLSAWGGIGANELEMMGGFQPSPSYQASKAALEGLTVHLAGRGGEHAIRVNCVRPGRILTRQWEETMGETFLFWSYYERVQMLQSHGRSEDVANAVLYLASNESSFVTAEMIDVNGGAVGKT